MGGQLTSGAPLGLVGPGLRQKGTETHKVSSRAGRRWLAAATHLGWTSSWCLVYVANRETQKRCPTAKGRSFSKAFKPTIFWELVKMTITNGTHLTGALRRLRGKCWRTLLGTALASSHRFLRTLPAPVTRPQALSQARGSQRFMM